MTDPLPIRPLSRPVPGSQSAQHDLFTVRDCVRYACSRFAAAAVAFGHGTDNAWDEAVWLVLWSVHLPFDHLDLVLDARLTAEERNFALQVIDRRCHERVPAAYLTGEAWLRGRRFICDARALVPRSLIAEAFEEALNDWLPEDGPEALLDLCTGGASLAVLAARRFAQARVCASDLSTDALALARENLTLHQMQERIELFQGDLFEPLAGQTFNLIVCNPPYVNAQSMDELPPEFQAEPRAALDGGDDGMLLVRRILAQAPAHLAPGGLLLLEIGHEAAHFEAAFPSLEFAYLPVTAGEDQLVLVSREQLLANTAAQ